jgi:hypothetical protein
MIHRKINKTTDLKFRYRPGSNFTGNLVKQLDPVPVKLFLRQNNFSSAERASVKQGRFTIFIYLR